MVFVSAWGESCLGNKSNIYHATFTLIFPNS